MPTTQKKTLQITTPSDEEIRIARSFDAPRMMVWDAYTRPELVKRWLGTMPGWRWAECEMDVREGGRYRWLWRGPDGTEMGLGGVYREVVPGERLVSTERYDPSWYEGEAVGTVEFTEAQGRTTLVTTLRYGSKQIRDAVLQSPATSGMEAGYALLDELLDIPAITTTAERPTAVIHLTVPRADIQKEMGPAHQELFAALAAQGIAPAGPWFSHHFRMDPATFDFEVGVPVSAPVKATGRVASSRLPAVRVARTVYRGGYEGLGAAWGEFETWMKGAGLKPAPELWEIYATGPESGSDPAGWRTELNRPIAD